jgi:hypothetical protein
MLKYGDISLINNGNSKSLVPRNLTYRQKELFKSNIDDSEILNIINTNTIENINTNNITSDNANVNIINTSILYVDLINKKTSTDNQIIINNKLQITNQDLSFNYLLSNDSIFKAKSLNIQIPEIKIEGYLDFSNNNIKFYKPLDLSANGIIKFGSNLQINDGSFNVITINSTSIDTSANINLLNNTPNIKFTTGNELIIKDTTNYIGFLNNNIKFYKPLDLSANGIIKFGSNLQINDGSFNVITINSTSIDTSANINLLNNTPEIKFKFGSNLQINDGSFNVITINSTSIDTLANINLLNNTPEIKFKDRLKLYNTTYSDNSSNAILIYNTSLNDYEKKYLKKVTIGITDISMNVYFCNIINNSTDSLTFTGKIVSVSNISNSSHIIFQGYSRIINGINTVTFTTNILFSSDPNWTIKTMRFENTNLVIEISDNSIITSNWIISLESIFI